MDLRVEVGFCAGDVYRFLEGQDGRQALLAKIVRNVRRDQRIIVSSIGWLLREDKVELSLAGGNKIQVKLR